MPIMDGIETTKRIRELLQKESNPTLIIACPALPISDETEKNEYLANGFSDLRKINLCIFQHSFQANNEVSTFVLSEQLLY